MANEIFKEEERKHKIYSNKFLCSKEKFSFANKQLTKITNDAANHSNKDISFFLSELETARAYELHYSVKGQVFPQELFQKKQHHLDVAFLSEKIKDACEQLARDRALKRDVSINQNHFGLSEIFENRATYIEIPAIEIYASLFQMLTEGDKDQYNKAKALVIANDQYFSEIERRNLYTYLSNFCSSQINRGETEFWAEIFSLYKILLDNQIIFQDGFLGEWYYKNIITVGTRLNEREWVEGFMEKYKDKLPPDRAANAYSFNKASYFYNIGELEKVLGLLLQVEYNDPRYSLGAKALLLQTYFDLNEDEALFSLTDSFRLFLRRNNLLADARKSGYANLFRLTKRATKVRAKKGFIDKISFQKEIDKLKRDYENAGNIFYKRWLGKKIDQIAG